VASGTEEYSDKCTRHTGGWKWWASQGGFVDADAGAKTNLFLPELPDSGCEWTVTRAEIWARGFDPRAVNLHARSVEDTRTPEELLDVIEARGKEVAAARLTGSSGAR
jgi:hypothetical protein